MFKRQSEVLKQVFNELHKDCIEIMCLEYQGLEIGDVGGDPHPKGCKTQEIKGTLFIGIPDTCLEVRLKSKNLTYFIGKPCSYVCDALGIEVGNLTSHDPSISLEKLKLAYRLFNKYELNFINMPGMEVSRNADRDTERLVVINDIFISFFDIEDCLDSFSDEEIRFVLTYDPKSARKTI